MSDAEITKCNRERLAKWGESLSRVGATAQVVIGICHNKNAGRLVIQMLEKGQGFTDFQIAQILSEAAKSLFEQHAKSQ